MFKYGLFGKGYDKEGYNKFGYDRSGFDKYGFDIDGYNLGGLQRIYSNETLIYALVYGRLYSAVEVGNGIVV